MPSQRSLSPLIATVADSLSSQYYSHTQIDNLFAQYRASGLPSDGNLINKITVWLNETTEPYALLGCVLENFMEQETQSTDWLDRFTRMERALA
jgi:hypothetical protein